MVKIEFCFLNSQKQMLLLDEATQAETNNSLSTNEIIEDTQSTQEEVHGSISSSDRGMFVFFLED